MAVLDTWKSGLLLVLTVSLLVQSQHVKADSQCDVEYSCISCSQVRICRRILGSPGGFQELFRLNCGGLTPFCDPARGSCSATPSHECADFGAFPCMKDGVYPDPSNCKSYHVCQNGTSHTFQCANGLSFDGSKCGTKNCHTISCDGKSGIKIPHPMNASTYGYCLNGKPLFMDSCPPAQEMYADQQQCLPACTHSGDLIPDPSDCTKYFSCYLASTGYTLTSYSCSQGERFDPSSRSCERTSVTCVPNRSSLPMVITVYY